MVTVEQDADCLRIDVEGDFTLTSAVELRNHLLQGLDSGKQLQLNLSHAGDVDITLLQLLRAVEREEGNRHAGIVSAVSDRAEGVAREIGFTRFPGIAHARGQDV